MFLHEYSPRGAALHSMPTFRVIALHDEQTAAERALEVARHLVDEMGLAETSEIRLWNVGLLDTDLDAFAVDEAASADLLVLTLRKGLELSLGSKVWLLRWLNQKRNSTAALIAAVEAKEDGSHETSTFFERLARGTGKEFFSYAVEGSTAEAALGVREFCWVI